MWRNDDCPCTRDCPKRSGTCHGTCGDYDKWVKKREADKKAAAVKAERFSMTNAQKKAMWKNCRRDNSKGCVKKFSS